MDYFSPFAQNVLNPLITEEMNKQFQTFVDKYIDAITKHYKNKVDKKTLKTIAKNIYKPESETTTQEKTEKKQTKEKEETQCTAVTQSGARCSRKPSNKPGYNPTLCTIHNKCERGESKRNGNNSSKEPKKKKAKKHHYSATNSDDSDNVETIDAMLMDEPINDEKVFQDIHGRIWNDKGEQIGLVNKTTGEVNLYAKEPEDD